VTVAGGIVPTQRLVPGLIERPGTTAPSGKGEAAGAVDQPTFSDLLSDMVESVNNLQSESAQSQQAFLAGEPVELHQMMIKAEEAGVAMDLLLEVRNKLLTAYNDLIKMPM
jgi:flagellar hook-basal body complex protein FliE